MMSKRKVLTLKEKINLIKFYDEALNKSEKNVRFLAKKFNIGKTQVSNVLKNKNYYVIQWERGSNLHLKRKMPSQIGKDIDSETFDWFRKARTKHLPISGTILKAKALAVAKTLNNTEFRASNGWLQKFLSRHNITLRAICGESADINQGTVDQWKEKLKLMVRGYEDRNVYNLDETGIFLRAIPSKTYSLRNEKCTGGKMSKDRLTILFCVNLFGNIENENKMVF